MKVLYDMHLRSAIKYQARLIFTHPTAFNIFEELATVENPTVHQQLISFDTRLPAMTTFGTGHRHLTEPLSQSQCPGRCFVRPRWFFFPALKFKATVLEKHPMSSGL